MGRWRLLEHAHEHPHEEISETLDELEERLEDVEHGATAPLVPNHDHTELSASVQSLRSDIERLQHESTHAAEIPLGALIPLESRVQALEARLENATHEQIETTHDTTEGEGRVIEETIEIPEEVIEPKRVHPMRHKSWPRIF